MGFNLWQKQKQNNKEVILALKSRLDTSTYQEDIIETLEKIYTLCFIDPELINNICFCSIIKSLKDTEENSLQLKILQILSLQSIDQIDLLNNIENRSVILMQDALFISLFLKIFFSDDLIHFFSQDPNITEVLRKLQKECYFNEIILFIKNSISLKEMLVFEGMVDDILSITPFQEYHYKIINEFLKDSEKNQFYFISSLAHLPHPINNDMLQTILITLNPSSKHFNEIQNSLFVPQYLIKALEYKVYKFIYFLIFENEKNFANFVKSFFEIDLLVVDCDTDIYAFKILEYIVKCTTIIIPQNNSFRINTLLFNLGLESSNLIINDYNSIDQIIYIFFTKDNLEELHEAIDLFSYDNISQLLWILLHKVTNSALNIHKTQLLAKLVTLRNYLITNEVTADSLQDQLIGTITQILSDNLTFFEKKDYVVTEPKIVLEPEIKEQLKSPSDSRNLYDDMKNNIKGIFNKFKISENKQNEGYDL